MRRSRPGGLAEFRKGTVGERMRLGAFVTDAEDVPVVSVLAGLDIAARIMFEHSAGVLLVVEPHSGAPVGTISTWELVASGGVHDARRRQAGAGRLAPSGW